MAEHDDPRVRKALASDGDIPLDVAELLLSDLDATVAAAARWVLDNRFASHEIPDPTVSVPVVDMSDGGWPS